LTLIARTKTGGDFAVLNIMSFDDRLYDAPRDYERLKKLGGVERNGFYEICYGPKKKQIDLNRKKIHAGARLDGHTSACDFCRSPRSW